MNRLQEVVRDVSRKIEKLEESRRSLVRAIRAIKDIEFRVGNLTRDRIINPVKKVELSSKICGVDGGLQTRSFHGIDVIVVRAVGVCMNFSGGKLVETRYHQSPTPRIFTAETASDAELILLSGLYRMREEIERSIDVVKSESPDYLLLDGPVYPHPSTETAKAVYPELYREVIRGYDRLLRLGEERGCRIIGVVEDSRSKYLSKIIREKIYPTLPETMKKLFPQVIHDFRDTSLLFGALQKGERTFTFKVSNVRGVNYGNRVYAFYLKTAKHDRPVRVEFVSHEPMKVVNEIASVVLSLSTFSTYGIPSVLIEADARAHLSDYYMEYIERLLAGSTPLLMNLRRESRPI